jgi:hypothetical protein
MTLVHSLGSAILSCDFIVLPGSFRSSLPFGHAQLLDDAKSSQVELQYASKVVSALCMPDAASCAKHHS